jgi:leucyl-tRNA synthetase
MKGTKSKYDHTKVEKKWQDEWRRSGIYTPDMENASKTFYNLWMFPYPSADGMHVGTIFASTGSDVYGRFMRMNQKQVFQPIGYDSFGIHAENYAIKKDEQPSKILAKTIKNYERQFREIGHAYDWTRTVTTSDADYYRWTQWLFVEMFKAGLAYRKKAFVNWCPSCKTVLSDEQVIDGKCERCGSEVEKRELEQWFFRITDYADRLLTNLDKIDWTNKVKIAQKNWIGKKSGAKVKFPLIDVPGQEDKKHSVEVFTTRIDTLFGATFIAVSPELAQKWIEVGWQVPQEVSEYISNSLSSSDDVRRDQTRVKTGVNTGIRAINPANGEEIPVYVADYVLTDVGTGAIMGVPAHDQRDLEFANKYNLEVRHVITEKRHESDQKITKNGVAVEELGVLINSGEFDGLASQEASLKIIDWLGESVAKQETHYHLRDWLISRQRYWGPPIPMIYCESCAKAGKSYFSDHLASIHADQSDWEANGWYAVEEHDLPVLLPHLEDYKPQGEGRGPLGNHPEFYNVSCPGCGGEAKRETDVSDTFLDSSWYFLRYPTVGSENQDKYPFDPEITQKWLPVDLYFGGAEHSVLHLMYARFVTMVFYDLEKLSFEEPFPKFYAHGLMIKDGAKMSKSKGNVVNPDEYITKFGADTLRLYLMFMGPMDGSPDFRDTGIEGMQRFIEKLWKLFLTPQKENPPEVLVKRHQTIRKVTQEISEFRYNTAIAALMEYVNVLKDQGVSKDDLQVLAQLLAPFAPHLAEEVWAEILGETDSIHTSEWPSFDAEYLVEDSITLPIQINGKMKATITISKDIQDDKEAVVALAREHQAISKAIEDIQAEVIYVPGRILNFVTR